MTTVHPIQTGNRYGRAIGRWASAVTSLLFGYLGRFATVALFLLDAAGRYAMATRATLPYAYAADTSTRDGNDAVRRCRS